MSFNYHCFNIEHREQCQLCDKNGDIVLEREEGDGVLPCPCNEEEKLKLLGENPSGLRIGNMTSAQIKKEKKARSHKDFMNNILPSMHPGDRADHLKRLNKK